MNRELLGEAARRAGIDLSADSLDQALLYAKLLKEASQKVNLTSITDDEEIASLHFEDSWQLSALLPRGARLIDVGTGAGFPGLALAIARPDLQVTLVDATLKKIKFLTEVSARLALRGVMPIHGRAEELGRLDDYRERFDVAVARAVTQLPVLAELCLPFVKIGGRLIAMKGEDSEMTAAVRALALLGGTPGPLLRYRLPSMEKPRSLVIIEKTSPTPRTYPRRMATIRQKPL